MSSVRGHRESSFHWQLQSAHRLGQLRSLLLCAFSSLEGHVDKFSVGLGWVLEMGVSALTCIAALETNPHTHQGLGVLTSAVALKTSTSDPESWPALSQACVIVAVIDALLTMVISLFLIRICGRSEDSRPDVGVSVLISVNLHDAYITFVFAGGTHP